MEAVAEADALTEELLEALQELSAASAKIFSDPAIRAGVELARAAIAKATGAA
jgi:hypothetical protein